MRLIGLVVALTLGLTLSPLAVEARQAPGQAKMLTVASACDTT